MTETLESLAKITSFRAVEEMEEAMRKCAQVDLPLVHRFTPGLYVREIFMKKGTLLTSKVHKSEHPYTISKGEVSVWTETEGVLRFKAPYTGITKPGTKRVLYIHEDTVWTTYHPTEETNLEKLETLLIQPPELKTINQGSPCLG